MARLQLLLALVLLAAVVAFAADDLSPAASPIPSVLTPIARTPIPSDAEAPSADDEEAGSVGSPLPTTARPPEEEGNSAYSLPPSEDDTASGASFGSATSMAAVAAISAAGYFML